MAAVDPRVFRNYDIRALVPELVDEQSEFYSMLGDPNAFLAPLDTEGVTQIGRGLACLFGAPKVYIGYDARLSGPAWAQALAEGFAKQGVDVVLLGRCTTDTIYYVSGKYNLPGVEITASHSPKELNGMKMVRGGAQVIGMGSGMEELRDRVLAGQFPQAEREGRIEEQDILPEYVDHLMQFIDPEKVRPLRIVADAGNGVGGLPAHEIFRRIPQLTVTELFFEPDGHFPNHGPNPFEPENIVTLTQEVKRQGADLGVAWDGDADRVFFVDETGKPIPGDFITALVARHFLQRFPGATIVYDIRASWVVPDWVKKMGGVPVSERVGHSFIKRTMRAHNAVFGGEVSGHYYFRDHFYADNGFIPMLAVLQMLSESGTTMSRLIASLGEYYISGEINSTVPDVQAVLERIKQRYADAKLDFRDGVTVEYPDWHFNVRPSANDPVIRLNLEAKSQEEMERRRDEVLALIRGQA
ncbi:MAG TPA: phosphomannomutase/phosphoglucomutase [Chthonomonas sp.]|jgi:phosphomannomutase|uniref:phosphomannomutase/phosphoglucomutase n=1 Tax=Chthonomonas sp. TaxID=2282153 RepID=UPI002B4AC94F|nr:phosphomannomutase/phosphoglucomutase [Chthonomonas sp.]HLH81315.1 phosphomannomutase/phosphoglucomutase [Chthonomonas sp.]